MAINNGFNNININGINQINVTKPPQVKRPEITGAGEFARILGEKTGKSDELKFSKHAQMRLQARNINLSPEQKSRISRAVQKAEEKGVKDSLILVDNIALVVNTKNRTVITAVSSSELKDNVFTNIDGAVFS